MAYHLKRLVNGMGYMHGSFPTLEDAISAAKRGQPTQTGTHEWAFLPANGKTLWLIAAD